MVLHAEQKEVETTITHHMRAHHPCARLTLYRRRGRAEASDVAGDGRELADNVCETADDLASSKSDVWKEKRWRTDRKQYADTAGQN